MWLAEKIFLLLTCLCYSNSLAQNAAEYPSYRKEWKFHENQILKFGKIIAAEDNSFLYANCAEDKLPVEINCNVTVESPISAWSSDETNKETCSLKLIGSQDGNLRHEITKIASIERFANDRAILVWWERKRNSQFQIHNIRVSILNMIECSTNHLTFPIDTDGQVLFGNVVMYENTFDVTISNKKLCGTNTCRITHNIDGITISDPIPFVTNFDSVYTEPVMLQSPSKGFYVSGSDINSWKFRAVYVNPDNLRKNLMTVSVSDPRDVYRATSNSHELYGICLIGDRKIHCAQFDIDGNVRMNATLKHLGNVQWIGVHNLVTDGLLLITGHCNNNKCRNFKITRVHLGGRQGKSLDVSGLHLKCSNVPRELSLDVAERGEDFCFYFACAYIQGKGFKSSVKFSVKCVPKIELIF